MSVNTVMSVFHSELSSENTAAVCVLSGRLAGCFGSIFGCCFGRVLVCGARCSGDGRFRKQECAGWMGSSSLAAGKRGMLSCMENVLWLEFCFQATGFADFCTQVGID